MALPNAGRGRRAAITSAAVLAAGVCLPATPASAGQPPDPDVIPGTNGTLKVHGKDTPLKVKANEPKQVCNFYLAGFGFDFDQVLNYKFTVQGGPNNGDAAGTPGSFTVGPGNGSPERVGRTPVLNAAAIGLTPDGPYKVTATTNDGSKSKVFKVNCPTSPDNPDDNPGPDDDDGVDDVNNPDDNGTSPTGGVDTGGGGTYGSGDAALPVLVGFGAAGLIGLALRRRRS